MEKELEKNKRETLEEARVNNLIKLFGKDFDLEPRNVIESCNDSFIEGAKWQQERMYNDEEVFNIIDKVFHMYASSYRKDAKEWFEEFKKK